MLFAPNSLGSPATFLTTLGSSAFIHTSRRSRIGAAAPNQPNFSARASGHARARSRGPSQLGRWRGGVGEEHDLPSLGSRFRARLTADRNQADSPTEDGQYGQGLRRESGGRKAPVWFGVHLGPGPLPRRRLRRLNSD